MLKLRALLPSFLTALLLVASASAAHAAKPLPPPPQFYVLDEPGVLDPRVSKAVQNLLQEQDKATGEQVVIAVFKSLEGEDLVDWTNRLFAHWKLGRKGKDNGILLALFWEDHKVRMEVGYGLEPIMTDLAANEILTQYVIPNLKAGDADRAVSTSAFRILQVLESPLIQNGQAQQILRSGGMNPMMSRRSSGNGFSFGLIFALSLLIWVLNRILSAEAHFTRGGWYRPRPRVFLGGGGFGGFGGGGFGGGGFGGFGGGGGGRSGGGGASGSW